MDDTILDSIIEITKARDSDEFGNRIVSTIAELIPNCVVALFKYNEFPREQYRRLTTLSIQKDEEGIKQHIWDVDIPKVKEEYINKHHDKFFQLTVYQTDDSKYHTFIPIHIDNKVAYAIDISSDTRLSNHSSSLIAIIKVCQNFYAILANGEKDSLTGLLNRRTYEQKLSSLLKKQSNNQLNNLNCQVENESRHLAQQSHTWLAIIDIDLFKNVNDRFGHIYGDEVLLVLSQLMQRAFRENDLLFRFGGEEFVLIFEPISNEQAERVLNKFREMVEKYRFPMVGKITVSCGFAKISKHEHPKTVFDNADKALYYAKENGRNSVYNYERLVEQNKIVEMAEEGDIELF